MSQFFSYDPEDAFKFHDTAEEAKASCEKTFDFYRQDAQGEGWHELVDNVCWGRVIGRVMVTKTTPRPPDDQLDEYGEDAEGNHWSGEFDALQDREIVEDII